MAPTLLRARRAVAGGPSDTERGGTLPRAGGATAANTDQPSRPSTGAQPRAAEIDGLSIFKPPYARITAIDMNKGTHVWMSPLGSGPRNHPLLQGLNVPPLGDFVDGESVLVTKTL